MSSRAEWSYNGKHFAETHTERGGLRYFIDGKPTAKRVWLAELVAAMEVTARCWGGIRIEGVASIPIGPAEEGHGLREHVSPVGGSPTERSEPSKSTGNA